MVQVLFEIMHGLGILVALEIYITKCIIYIDQTIYVVRPLKNGQALQCILQRAIVVVQIIQQITDTGEDYGLREFITQFFIYRQRAFKVSKNVC